MQTMMQSRMERLKGACTALRMKCPVCGAALTVSGNALVCEYKHSYNLNRKGFVSFLNKPVDSCYDEALFEARGRVFASGAYDGVAEAIGSMLPPETRTVLDAGCGDGWYLSRLLCEREGLTGAGVDISRDAIACAARREGNAAWLAADLRKMPFEDAAFDVVLDVLTPADYQAFSRVLSSDGLLIKVYPGAEYLKELRQARGLPLYQEGAVQEWLSGHGEVVAEKHVVKTCAVTPLLWRDFVRMTPLNQDLNDEEREKLPVIETVTIDLHVSAVKLKKS